MSVTPTIPASAAPSTDLDRLKQAAPTLEGEKARLRQATKEFEAFFMYYMLKTMRETVPDNPLTKDVPFGNSMGKDTFTQLFDMEVAREMVSSDRQSIGEMLYQSFERVLEAKFGETSDESAEATPLLRRPEPVRLPPRSIELPPASSGPGAIERQRGQTEQLLPRTANSMPLNRDNIRSRYGRIIDEAARETQLDSALIASVIRAESGGNPKAVSGAGAKGLMQLIDTTAQDLGVTDVYDPEENIKAGSRYLRRMFNRFGDIKLALAAYNAGPGNVTKFGGVPPFKETREYVDRVISHAKRTGAKIEM